ncbi:hypothetical protein Ppa06_69600 [Planomonospora parontospora subsp. parontospora]|uniref:Uncharacterized protein n=2 Tax=Planomonospora parontospora TaxID=58119 RepID=A0AA37F7U0_9ACTN|nr:hypothetical protein GCM10010126_63830 [Planomonospora parontospora]GII13162.1 hypothetical protein Ppa06_69600 [Planomonospora parontospora subsp. parontospora]
MQEIADVLLVLDHKHARLHQRPPPDLCPLSGRSHAAARHEVRTGPPCPDTSCRNVTNRIHYVVMGGPVEIAPEKHPTGNFSRFVSCRMSEW